MATGRWPSETPRAAVRTSITAASIKAPAVAAAASVRQAIAISDEISHTSRSVKLCIAGPMGIM